MSEFHDGLQMLSDEIIQILDKKFLKIVITNAKCGRLLLSWQIYKYAFYAIRICYTVSGFMNI